MPQIPSDTMSKLPKLLTRVRTWGSSITKIYEHERWEKILEDSRNAITTEDIKGILTFEPSIYAEQCFKRAESDTANLGEFLAIRDYLIVRLGIENAQRPGPMETARLRDFQCVEDDDAGSKVMYVARHKTSRGGPAPLVMKSSLYKKVKINVEFVRPKFAQEGEEALFVTQDGKGFDNGTIGKRITAWWKKATGKSITSTDLRKLTGSTLHDADPVEKRIIHGHMCHKEQTAEKFYMTRNKVQVAGKSHRSIVNRLGIEGHEEEEANEESASVEEQLADNQEKSNEDTTTPRKIELSKDQLQDIDLLFSEQISSNAKLSIGDVRKTMLESLSLMQLAKDESGVRKVYNRVRYRQRGESASTIGTIEDTSREDVTEQWVDYHSSQASTSQSLTSRRRKWSLGDEEAIERAFEKFDLVPSKNEIKIMFNTDKVCFNCTGNVVKLGRRAFNTWRS